MVGDGRLLGLVVGMAVDVVRDDDEDGGRWWLGLVVKMVVDGG